MFSFRDLSQVIMRMYRNCVILLRMLVVVSYNTCRSACAWWWQSCQNV